MNYLKIYCNLMRKAEKRNLTKKEAKEKKIYVEGHHIFPKSIYGNNKRIVYLTGREHYIAHAILEKVFIQRYGLKHIKTIKMTHAHCRMIGNGTYINARLYESARKRQIDNWRNIKKKKESIEKQRQSILGRFWWTDGKNAKLSYECPGDGWYKGRKDKQKLKKKLKKKKIDVPSVWWTNGIQNKKQKKFPGEGWYKGKTDFSKKNTKWWNNGYRQKLSHSSPGGGWKLGQLESKRNWWNDGVNNKMAKKCPGDGWVLGMLPTENMIGKKLWNNGKVQVKSNECPGEEFSLGSLQLLNKNRCWWTNGIDSIRSKNCPGEGWYRGHSIKIENRCTSKGTMWWNDGNKNIRAKECPGDNWKRGMLR